MMDDLASSGGLLRRYRRECTDPLRGGPLTLERLAELLGEELGGVEYSIATVSNWERGIHPINKDDRDLLVGWLKVLHANKDENKGLGTLNQADELLAAGNYRRLDEDEIARIDPDWLCTPLTAPPIFPSQPEPAQRDATFSPSAGGALVHRLGRAIRNLLRTPAAEQGRPTPRLALAPRTCGDQGLELGSQRLLVSSAFGSYFVGLLEREHSYVDLQHQIDCPAPLGHPVPPRPVGTRRGWSGPPSAVPSPVRAWTGQHWTVRGEALAPIERIFWALHGVPPPRGLCAVCTQSRRLT